jgi:hypothetical protein
MADRKLLFQRLAEFNKALVRAARAYARLMELTRKQYEEWLRRMKASAGHC